MSATWAVSTLTAHLRLAACGLPLVPLQRLAKRQVFISHSPTFSVCLMLLFSFFQHPALHLKHSSLHSFYKIQTALIVNHFCFLYLFLALATFPIPTTMEESETLDQMQARHRRELRELQGRVTSKKKNATKKTRRGVNDECAGMERELRERQEAEVAALSGGAAATQDDGHDDDEADDGTQEGKSGLRKVEDKIEEKLEKAAEKLHISQALPSNDDGGAGAGAGAAGAGKKRNRQKERLARRAAEQEAAAQRAEDEASAMTDDRARESEYMRKTFEAHGLAEKDIEPDGHCLFSAVADQLAQNGVSLDKEEDEAEYKAVRRAAAGYMAEHGDDFAPFLEDDLAEHVAAIRDTAEWGGQPELTALARRYGVEIRVVQDGRTERIGEEEGKGSGKTLWLAYYRHGYGLGEHYNSLRVAK